MKIFHTGDLHIGMKFNNYPEPVRSELKQARTDVLGKMVSIANKQECNIFVVAGDLFHSINGNTKKTIGEVVTALKGFHGECVLVLPGNHDYDNNLVELWKTFQEIAQDIHNIVFINQERPYSLAEWDLNATVYPAPCHSKHSDVNNIGWIQEEIIKEEMSEENIDKEQVRIGIAHGALEGISPDLDSSYYNMSLAELAGVSVDVWLLGHTHLTYPDKKTVTGWKVFNPGTPEPDGLDCRHNGNAWILTIRDNKEVSGELIETGSYKFRDQRFAVGEKEDFEKIVGELLKDDPCNTIARLRFNGKLEEETFNYRHEVRRKLEESLGYLIFDDSEVGIKITSEMIHKEFSDGSFPSMLLTALSEDEEALQLAYELILEVKG